MRLLKEKKLIIIIVFGALLRIAFLLFGAELYYGKSTFFFDSDTLAWQQCFDNLINDGTYKVDGENGFFARMPGYAFFIGIIKLITNQNWIETYQTISWIQSLIDIINIYLIYKISLKIYKRKVALLSSLFYATYPFIIVWNPIAYSELLSVFLLLLSLFFFTNINLKNSFFSGFFLALAALTRPQILPLFGIYFLVMLIPFKKLDYNSYKYIFIFAFSFVIIYGAWPLRNYLNHDRLIITKNAEGFPDWTKDVISFMQFTYSVKTEWDPQYTSIIKNKNTIFPKEAYIDYNDSIILEEAIYLSKHYGSGFSNKRGYWKKAVIDDEIEKNDEIAKKFNYLTNKQKQKNPFNFYVVLPLKNLKKALFKNSFYDQKSKYRKYASFLFYGRSFLIVTGLLGILFSYFKKEKLKFNLLFLLFFIFVYCTLCFGTAPFMRNIEIRYFLQSDILLIMPASYLLNKILIKIKNEKKIF